MEPKQAVEVAKTFGMITETPLYVIKLKNGDIIVPSTELNDSRCFVKDNPPRAEWVSAWDRYNMPDLDEELEYIDLEGRPFSFPVF